MRTVMVTMCLLSSAAYGAPNDAENPRVDPRYTDAIGAAAKGFAAWGRVDYRPNIAPNLCRAPKPADYGASSHLRMSAAAHAPHGKKLYYLWASDKPAYLDSRRDVPVGFSIVKESFEAVAVDAAHPPADPHAPAAGEGWSAQPASITWMVTPQGEKLTTGTRKDLFVMTKVGDQPGSDAGWVYGTVTPDGTVTSAGRVASCMGCHTSSATHERLFGLPPAPKS
ncbi:MAG: cytochrome P460 family protein [Kofleriaceae bacterium]